MDSNIRYPYKGEGSRGFERFKETCSHSELVALYRSMLRIRRIEEEIERRYHQDFMKTPIHLVIGQEAAAVGCCAALRPVDLVYTSHRTHGAYLAKGGHALFMLDPFVRTGLEPVLLEYGIVVDDDIVIDEASHFWADPSSPAVTDYNRHQVTRELPLTFFPGARSLSPTRERVPNTSVLPLINSSKKSWGQANRERIDFTPANLAARRLTRCISVPTAQRVPGGACSRVRMMYSVLPARSAFCTTSHLHSVWKRTLHSGSLARMSSTCFSVKRPWTLQWPFQR